MALRFNYLPMPSSGIAGTYTNSAGILNVTSTIPNTVNFNGSGAQSVNGGTYHHLTLSNGSTKNSRRRRNGQWQSFHCRRHYPEC